MLAVQHADQYTIEYGTIAPWALPDRVSLPFLVRMLRH